MDAENLQSFEDKDAFDVATWLKENGIPLEICDKFDGRSLFHYILMNVELYICYTKSATINIFLFCVFCEFIVDEEIDGSGFLDLTECDIKSLVPKLGIVKKISRLQKLVS